MIIEKLRLQAVSQFVNFDLERDEELLEIVEMASAAADLPYAVISFLDENTSYLKVRKGVEADLVPREYSFCTHVIEQDDLLMVRDTLLDERFSNNPFVTDGPRLRFFCSMPLVAHGGEKIGTLCVLDTRPRTLDQHQQLFIKVLAKQVMKVIELRAGIQLLEQNQAELEVHKRLNIDSAIRLRSFFESSTNFQVLLDKDGGIIDFNKTAFNFIKAVHKVKIVRGDQFVKYLAPDFVATFVKHYNMALQGQKSFVDGSTVYDEMGIIYWEAAFEAARDDDDNIVGISYLIRNVTERKLKEQKILSQNASLLKIAHIQAHEFRAPLASIMGMMSLIKEDDYRAPKEYMQLLDQAVQTLDTTIRRIVHDIDSSVIPEYADNQ